MSAEDERLLGLRDSLLGRGPGQGLDPQARLEAVRENTLLIETAGGWASGLLLTRDGCFVTALHALGEADVPGARVRLPQPGAPQLPVERILCQSRAFDLVLARLTGVRPSPRSTRIVLGEHPASVGTTLRAFSRCDGLEQAQGRLVQMDPMPEGQARAQTHAAEPRELLRPYAFRGECFSTCDTRPGWSGGPVVEEESGLVVGITLGRVRCNDGSKYHRYADLPRLRRLLGVFLQAHGVVSGNALSEPA